MNRRPVKMVKGLLINPFNKSVTEVEYNGNNRFCVEDTLEKHYVDYRTINGEGIKDKTICMFIDNDQEDLVTTDKPFSFNGDVFFGKALIVKLGEYENEYDFNTKSLSKKLLKELPTEINFNLKVNFKEETEYRTVVESIEMV